MSLLLMFLAAGGQNKLIVNDFQPRGLYADELLYRCLPVTLLGHVCDC